MSAALGYIYDSPFYAKLYDEESKWWYLDTESLYRLLEKCWSDDGHLTSNNVVVFLTFCVENYAKKYSMTSLEAYALFRRYRVDEYLVNGFDMLHTKAKMASCKIYRYLLTIEKSKQNETISWINSNG